MFARIALNLPVRLSYFFLPAVARGLAISLPAAGFLVGVRSVAGLAAPFFGVLGDRMGERRVMVLGMGMLVAGAALVGASQWFALAALAFGILGLSKSAFDPAMQGFLGHRVPYERRARALGLAEMAWSGALLGMPLCGWLIDHVNWRAPFALIAVLGILGWWLTRRALSPLGDSGTHAHEGDAGSELYHSLLGLWRDRDARLALAITALLMLAQDNLMVVYGAWMEDRFGLTVTALGMVTLVFGAAELTAELGVALLSDRLGKRRTVFLSLVLTGCAYLLLPHLTGGLLVALSGTVLVILAFEFSIVGLIPIVSGLSATARGTLMSLNVAAAAVGRMVAAPLAVTLYGPGDLVGNGAMSAAVCVLLLILLSLLRERGH
jgi:predicted MFS family arabinose efflux permease